jgi:hypothetical protein
MVNMTKIREKSHVFMWILLVFFLLSMTVGGLVGGANIVDNIKGLFTGEKKDTVMKIVDSSSNKSMYNKIDESFDIRYFDSKLKMNGYYQSDLQQRKTIMNKVWSEIQDSLAVTQRIDELDLVPTEKEIENYIVNSTPPSMQEQLMASGLYVDTLGNFLIEDFKYDYENKTYQEELTGYFQMWEQSVEEWMPKFRLTQIYNSIASVSEFEIKDDFIKNNIECTVDYIYISHRDIADSLVVLDESNVLAKYNEDKEKYLLFESKTLDYILWSTDLTDIDSTEHATYLEDVSDKTLDFADLAYDIGFDKAVDSLKLTVDFPIDVTMEYTNNSGVPYAMGESRSPVRYAFRSDLRYGDYSDPMRMQNGWVIFRYIGDKEERYKPFEDVKDAISKNLIRDLKKVYANDELAKIISSSTDFELIATENELVKYKSNETKKIGASFSDVGRSNMLTGTLKGMSADNISGVVETYSSAMVIKLISKTPFDETSYNESHDEIMDRLLARKKNNHFSGWLQSFKNNYEIDDNRYLYY